MYNTSNISTMSLTLNQETTASVLDYIITLRYPITSNSVKITYNYDREKKRTDNYYHNIIKA